MLKTLFASTSLAAALVLLPLSGGGLVSGTGAAGTSLARADVDIDGSLIIGADAGGPFIGIGDDGYDDEDDYDDGYFDGLRDSADWDDDWDD